MMGKLLKPEVPEQGMTKHPFNGHTGYWHWFKRPKGPHQMVWVYGPQTDYNIARAEETYRVYPTEWMNKWPFSI